jgi:hypothetical protein
LRRCSKNYGEADLAGYGGDVERHLVLAYGVLGAVILGWFALVWRCIGRLERGDRSAWADIAVSLGLWFVVDTTHSVVSRSLGNVLLNVAVAVPAALGLWWLRGGRAAVAEG